MIFALQYALQCIGDTNSILIQRYISKNIQTITKVDWEMLILLVVVVTGSS